MLEDDKKKFELEEQKLTGITPEEELSTELTDEDLEIMSKMGNEVMSRKKTEYKEIEATKAKILARGARLFPIKVESDDGEILILKAKRLTEKERVKMSRVVTQSTDPFSLSSEEQEAIQRQSYELLSIVIKEPAMSVDEWEQVDIAFTQKVLEHLSVLQTETSDAEIIDQLRNL